MTADEDPRWHAALNAMRLDAKTAPDDPELAISAMHALADLVVQLGDTLQEDQIGALIGVGALLWRESLKEAKAKIQTLIALGTLKPISRSAGGMEGA